MNTSAALTLDEGMAHLASIVGPEHAQLRGDTVVAAPGDTQQVAQLLRFAQSNGLTVMPTGGSTKLGWGNPVMPEIELSMHRMHALRDHPWQDMTCTVEAGCTGPRCSRNCDATVRWSHSILYGRTALLWVA